MAKPFDVTGYWWISSSPEDKIPGTLKFSENEYTTLELNGCFESCSSRKHKNTAGSECDIICGIDYQRNRYCLINNILTNYSVSSYEISKFQVNIVIKGIFLDSSSDTVFNRIRLHFPKLESWQFTDLMEYSEKDGIDTISCNFNPCDNTIDVPLDDGFFLSLHPHIYTSSEYSCYGRSFAINRCTCITIRNSSSKTIFEFLNKVTQVQQLVSFIFMAPQYANEIAIGLDNNDDTGLLEVFVKNGTSANAPFGPLLKYSVVHDKLRELIRRWFEFSDDIDMIIGNYIRTMDSSKSIGAEDFLLIAQSVEGLAKAKFSIHDKSFGSLLDKVYAYMSSIDYIKCNRVDSEVARVTRNYYTHFYKDNNYNKVAHGQDRLRIQQQLKLLLNCMLMKCFGLDDEQINNCLQYSAYVGWTFLAKPKV